MRYINKVELLAKLMTDRDRAAQFKSRVKDVVKKARPYTKQGWMGGPSDRSSDSTPEQKPKPSFLKEVKNPKDAAKFQKDLKESTDAEKARANAKVDLELYIDIIDQGTSYNTKKPFKKFSNVPYVDIKKKSYELLHHFESSFGEEGSLGWYAGSDGTDGAYSSDTVSLRKDDDKFWKYFNDEPMRKDFEEDSETEDLQVHAVLHIKPKGSIKLTGRELKDKKAS